MKTLTAGIILTLLLIFSGSANAGTSNEENLHDLHMIMRFMDHGLSIALEGTDLQMLGQMGESETLDRVAIVHGTIMVKDGKAMIREMLEGKAMQTLYKEKKYDQKVMDDLHVLGEKMLKVIEQVEKLHEDINKQK